jgi:hypothetical protein
MKRYIRLRQQEKHPKRCGPENTIASLKAYCHQKPLLDIG